VGLDPRKKKNLLKKRNTSLPSMHVHRTAEPRHFAQEEFPEREKNVRSIFDRVFLLNQKLDTEQKKKGGLFSRRGVK
jgi:hypothetical protein